MSSTGLRAIKDVALLDHLEVTPELEAQLMQSLEAAEARGPVVQLESKPRRTWLRPAAYAGAAAAVLALAFLAAPRPTAGVTEQPVPLPAPYQQVGSTTVTSKVTNAQGIQLKVADAKANPVTVQDQSGQSMSPQTPAEAQPGRKIITNGEFGIRVSDASAAMQRLEQAALDAGGYVAEDSLNEETTGAWTGRIVLRVPAVKAGSIIAILRQVGTVERQRQWTQDVTDQYMDLEHRIEILKEQEQTLRQLADKAATFDDWNKLTAQINSTRVDIENMTGKLKLLANQVDYAILNVQIAQPAPNAVVPPQGATTLPGRMGEAFTGSLRTMGATLAGLTVGLAAIGPYLLVALLGAGSVLLWLRRRRRAA